jgi:hypothetical protein
VPQQELDLLQFASVDVAQLRAGPAKFMRSEMIKLDTGSHLRRTTMLNRVPVDAQPQRFCCSLRISLRAKFAGCADDLLPK